MLKKLFIKLTSWFVDYCPDCGEVLDNDHHGFDQKWLHCHNCNYCTYEQYYAQVGDK